MTDRKQRVGEWVCGRMGEGVAVNLSSVICYLSFLVRCWFRLSLNFCLIAKRLQLIRELPLEGALGFGWQIRFLLFGDFWQGVKLGSDILGLNFIPQTILELFDLPMEDFAAQDFCRRQGDGDRGSLHRYLALFIEVVTAM